MLRRILYLQQILKQENENSLLFRFFKAQMNNPSRGDWAIQIMKDLEEIGLKMSLDEIKHESEEKFTKLTKLAITSKALTDLNTLKKAQNIEK